MGFQKCPVTISEHLKYNRKNIDSEFRFSKFVSWLPL